MWIKVGIKEKMPSVISSKQQEKSSKSSKKVEVEDTVCAVDAEENNKQQEQQQDNDKKLKKSGAGEKKDDNNSGGILAIRGDFEAVESIIRSALLNEENLDPSTSNSTIASTSTCSLQQQQLQQRQQPAEQQMLKNVVVVAKNHQNHQKRKPSSSQSYVTMNNEELLAQAKLNELAACINNTNGKAVRATQLTINYWYELKDYQLDQKSAFGMQALATLYDFFSIRFYKDMHHTQCVWLPSLFNLPKAGNIKYRGYLKMKEVCEACPSFKIYIKLDALIYHAESKKNYATYVIEALTPQKAHSDNLKLVLGKWIFSIFSIFFFLIDL